MEEILAAKNKASSKEIAESDKQEDGESEIEIIEDNVREIMERVEVLSEDAVFGVIDEVVKESEQPVK